MIIGDMYCYYVRKSEIIDAINVATNANIANLVCLAASFFNLTQSFNTSFALSFVLLEREHALFAFFSVNSSIDKPPFIASIENAGNNVMLWVKKKIKTSQFSDSLYKAISSGMRSDKTTSIFALS